MYHQRSVFPVAVLSIVCVFYSVVVMDTAKMDFKSAIEFVRSQGVVIDIKEHEIPGTKQLVNDPLSQNQMSGIEADHAEAIKIALREIEALARTVTGNETYRRVDGIANNLANPRQGAAFHFENRLLPASYRDGIGLPRTIALSGNPLPGARTVSVKCFLPSKEEKAFFDRNTSQLFVQFGQFIDHEVIATALTVAFHCCSGKNHTNVSSEWEPCFNIYIDKGDRFFRNRCMNFRRAFGVIVNGQRQQVNTATSFLDCSTTYGSTSGETASLRQFQKGLLKVTSDNMLPLSNTFPCVKSQISGCPLSGDSRTNEVPGLCALHLIFHREHNRLARKLVEVNPHWNDEKLFQEARKMCIAELQRIVYYEFLPKLLGPEVMEIFKLNKPYRYDPLVDPSILNDFGIAYRFGHTMLSGELNTHGGVYQPLSNLFFRPEVCMYHGESTLKGIVRGQSRNFAHKFDSSFTTEIMDRLYIGVDAEAEPGESFDLLARNVQRGRDQGIPPYVNYLNFCLKKLQNITGVTQLTLPTCLITGVYENINDIDLFPGGVGETPLVGGILGPTFACIIGEQFRRLKFGDRYFSETPNRTLGFASGQLKSIGETATLSALICRNTEVRHLQPRALDSRRSSGNARQPCENYPDLNFKLWREKP